MGLQTRSAHGNIFANLVKRLRIEFLILRAALSRRLQRGNTAYDRLALCVVEPGAQGCSGDCLHFFIGRPREFEFVTPHSMRAVTGIP